MGLFGKKEVCPVCGGEVKGLFLVKISDKQTLCKDCSKRVSMCQELLQNATPEFIREHFVYRQKNAEIYNELRWDVKYEDIPDIKVGVDQGAGFFYLIHNKLQDEDNPVVFAFSQLTGYELYRMNKKVDDAETPGDTALESGLSLFTGIASLAKDKNSTDYFKLKLTMNDPYWPELELKITFVSDRLYSRIGWTGFDGQLKAVCQMFKHIIRKEPVNIS